MTLRKKLDKTKRNLKGDGLKEKLTKWETGSTTELIRDMRPFFLVIASKSDQIAVKTLCTKESFRIIPTSKPNFQIFGMACMTLDTIIPQTIMCLVNEA